MITTNPDLENGLVGHWTFDGDLQMQAGREAANGYEAIERCRALRPHVILMNLQMPEMSGIDAIAAIRAEFPDARIAVLTTYCGG